MTSRYYLLVSRSVSPVEAEVPEVVPSSSPEGSPPRPAPQSSPDDSSRSRTVTREESNDTDRSGMGRDSSPADRRDQSHTLQADMQEEDEQEMEELQAENQERQEMGE